MRCDWLNSPQSSGVVSETPTPGRIQQVQGLNPMWDQFDKNMFLNADKLLEPNQLMSVLFYHQVLIL